MNTKKKIFLRKNCPSGAFVDRCNLLSLMWVDASVKSDEVFLEGPVGALFTRFEEDQ